MQLVRILLFLLLVLPITMHAQKKRISVLIDAGHGGNDPGHLSSNSAHLQEKELNLIIAKKVGNYLTNNLQNVDVTYTRTSDEFVSLDARVERPIIRMLIILSAFIATPVINLKPMEQNLTCILSTLKVLSLWQKALKKNFQQKQADHRAV